MYTAAVPPDEGEFGICARGPKCLNDGATRRSKKSFDTCRFSRFDTIPAVTESHSPSHVAVAIRLYASRRA